MAAVKAGGRDAQFFSNGSDNNKILLLCCILYRLLIAWPVQREEV